MADDTLALLASLGIGQADLLGYSLGAGIALTLSPGTPPWSARPCSPR